MKVQLRFEKDLLEDRDTSAMKVWYKICERTVKHECNQGLIQDLCKDSETWVQSRFDTRYARGQRHMSAIKVWYKICERTKTCVQSRFDTRSVRGQRDTSAVKVSYKICERKERHECNQSLIQDLWEDRDMCAIKVWYKICERTERHVCNQSKRTVTDWSVEGQAPRVRDYSIHRTLMDWSMYNLLN